MPNNPVLLKKSRYCFKADNATNLFNILIARHCVLVIRSLQHMWWWCMDFDVVEVITETHAFGFFDIYKNILFIVFYFVFSV